MQRWIVLGVVAMLLVLGGAGFAFWNYKQNRPAPMWVALPVNREFSEAQQEELATELKARLDKPAVLLEVSKDLGLAKNWSISDEAAASEISKRLFVKVGEMASPIGNVPAINIGVEGPRKEMKVSGEIAMRLVREIAASLGIEPPRTAR